GSGGDRRLLRARDAGAGDAPALRRGAAARHRALPRLCRADRRGWAPAPLQHVHPRGPRGTRRWALSEDPLARPCRARTIPRVPAPREALLRCGQSGLPGLARVRRRGRHVHLQRPALARDVSRDGAPGRGADLPRLQHTRGQPARAGARSAGPFPQSPRHAVGRVPECDVGGGRGQVRARGGLRHDRPERDHRALGRDRGDVLDAGGRAGHRALRSGRRAVLQGDGVQLRPPPAPRALPPDRRPHRGGAARLAKWLEHQGKFGWNRVIGMPHLNTWRREDMTDTGVLHLDDKTFDETLATTEGVLMVDFWVEWCGPCRAVSPVLEDLARTSGGKVTLAKVNVDDNPTLAARFGVRSIPTILFVKDGKIRDQAIGALPKAALQKKIETLG